MYNNLPLITRLQVIVLFLVKLKAFVCTKIDRNAIIDLAVVCNLPRVDWFNKMGFRWGFPLAAQEI